MHMIVSAEYRVNMGDASNTELSTQLPPEERVAIGDIVDDYAPLPEPASGPQGRSTTPAFRNQAVRRNTLLGRLRFLAVPLIAAAAYIGSIVSHDSNQKPINTSSEPQKPASDQLPQEELERLRNSQRAGEITIENRNLSIVGDEAERIKNPLAPIKPAPTLTRPKR